VYEFLDYRVCDVMSRPECVGPETSLAEFEEILEKRGFNALPVVDEENRLIGFASALDLLRAFSFPEDTTLPPLQQTMKFPVARVMTREVKTVTPRTPLTRVLEKLVKAGSRSLPVVEDDRVVGVVSRRDVMNALRRADAGERP
jgi:CBS domain-containing protein